jgi:hypothetical protein
MDAGRSARAAARWLAQRIGRESANDQDLFGSRKRGAYRNEPRDFVNRAVVVDDDAELDAGRRRGRRRQEAADERPRAGSTLAAQIRARFPHQTEDVAVQHLQLELVRAQHRLSFIRCRLRLASSAAARGESDQGTGETPDDPDQYASERQVFGCAKSSGHGSILQQFEGHRSGRGDGPTTLHQERNCFAGYGFVNRGRPRTTNSSSHFV